MIISYHFSFDDGREMSFNVDLDRHYDAAKAKKAASWTALDNNKCQNCPLSSSDHQHCPAAVDLDDVICAPFRILVPDEAVSGLA